MTTDGHIALYFNLLPRPAGREASLRVCRVVFVVVVCFKQLNSTGLERVSPSRTFFRQH